MESNKKPSNPKDAIGVTKPPLSTVSQSVMAMVGLAMLEGSLKYGRHNYRAIGVRASVYYDAAQRHLNRWWEGQDTDPDSGLNHVFKAIAGLMVLADSIIQSKLTDDRPPAVPNEFWAGLDAEAKRILANYPNPELPYTEVGQNLKDANPIKLPDANPFKPLTSDSVLLKKSPFVPMRAQLAEDIDNNY